MTEFLEKIGVSSIFATATVFLGGWDKLTQALIFLIVLDYASGVFSAISNKRLNSKIGFKGIFKKLFMLVVVATSVSLENILEQPNTIRNIVILFYIGNEITSILENATESGLLIPKVIKDKLKIFNNEEEIKKDE